MNLAVSFYLAFRLALKSQGVSDVNRQRIQAAIRYRLRKAPMSFLWPVDARQEAQAREGVEMPPADDQEEAADAAPGRALAQVERGAEGR